ncbi:Mediator of RNA polymerase II transcription subunit 16 [Liparis tanakae]|uniref:Mediator of RNA polymerase II transcription subunit 16 n=1 Tax=Liparis tanakae TaxID=230148 RepID=A0A4Z2ERB4_9TELE|nr:Mediator of RNA polymerase II transcription subunit 16 [Liparis tanakae]
MHSLYWPPRGDTSSYMELAYVCEWEKRPKSTHCPSIPLVCSWSCRNLVAFSTDLKGEDDDKDVSHMIHIIDTEHPWDVYSISSGHTEVISCLEWDQSGSRLLSADGDGQIKCWSMSEHLVNSWESVLSSSLDGDPIVALSWLHNGVKLALHVEMVTTRENMFRPLRPLSASHRCSPSHHGSPSHRCSPSHHGSPSYRCSPSHHGSPSHRCSPSHQW